MRDDAEVIERIARAEPDGGDPALKVILRRARTLRRRGFVGLAAASALAVVASVTVLLPGTRPLTLAPADPAEEVSRGAYSPGAAIDPTRMELEPAVAHAGQIVAVHYPRADGRGICLSLERDVAGDWDARFLLYGHPATAAEPVEPAWAALDGDAVVDPCPDVRIEGPGPDHVRVPADALPGRYRVCTVHTGADYCAELRVTER